MAGFSGRGAAPSIGGARGAASAFEADINFRVANAFLRAFTGF
jgi:hypothetical protein